MPLFLYEATDSGGKPATGFQDAATVRAAYDALTLAGLRDIRILDSQTSAAVDDAYFRSRSPEARQEDAQSLRRFRQSDNFRAEMWKSTRAQIRESIAAHRSFHAVVGLILLYCLWQGVWLGVAGVLMIYGGVALKIWQVHRWWDLKQELEQAQVEAEWDKALALIARLRANKEMCDEPDVDLDFREAGIRARQGADMEAIVACLSPWRERLADKPGAFEARLLGIYLAGHCFDRYVEAARHSLQAVPDDPTRQVDLALAAARFGSVAEARAVLERLDTRLLSAGLRACVQWIEGLIALRSGDPGRALAELESAMTVVRANLARSPRAPVLLAQMAGARCLALARSGRQEEAARTLAEAWPLLRLHGDQGLAGMMASLRREVGLPATT